MATGLVYSVSMSTDLVYYCHSNANALAPLYWHESIALNCLHVYVCGQDSHNYAFACTLIPYPRQSMQQKATSHGGWMETEG